VQGQQGQKGDPGATGGSDSWDSGGTGLSGLDPGAFQTVAFVDLPAGNFFVAAKTSLYDAGRGAHFACKLSPGFDETIANSPAAFASVAIPLQEDVTLLSPGRVSLECATDGSASATEFARIDALEVGTLH
jgi:hypothetical protein